MEEWTLTNTITEEASEGEASEDNQPSTWKTCSEEEGDHSEAEDEAEAEVASRMDSRRPDSWMYQVICNPSRFSIFSQRFPESLDERDQIEDEREGEQEGPVV